MLFRKDTWKNFPNVHLLFTTCPYAENRIREVRHVRICYSQHKRVDG